MSCLYRYLRRRRDRLHFCLVSLLIIGVHCSLLFTGDWTVVPGVYGKGTHGAIVGRRIEKKLP